MLELMRKKSGSAIVIGVFGIIILVFVFWGVNPGGDGGGGTIAVVDGYKISTEEYRALYRRQLDYFKESAGDNYSEEMLESINLRQRTIGTLISNVLIVKAAKKEGVKVSKKDIQQEILSMAAFQKDGVFDKETYSRVLSRNRLNVADFEEGMEQDLLMKAMQERVIAGVSVTEDGAWEEFAKAKRGVSLYYVKHDPALLEASVEFTDQEAKEFFDNNNFRYIVPVKVNAFYGKIAYEDLVGEVNVADEDVKAYYEDNKSDFFQDEAVKASHILVRSGDDKEAARKKAEGLLKKAKGGANFAKLAKKHSEDSGSAKRGGNLGYFGRGKMVKSFEMAAFSLAPGEVSELVETNFGFHIIKVEARRELGPLPLKRVRADIEDVMKKNQALFMARDRIESLEAVFASVDDMKELKKLAAKEGVKVGLTGLFSAADTGSELGVDESLRNAAFGLNAGGVSAPVEARGAVYLIKIIERIEEHVAPYDDVSKDVATALTAEKAVEKARGAAEEMLAKLSDGGDLKALAKEAGLDVGTTDFITMLHPDIHEINLQLNRNPGVFELTAEDPVYADYIVNGASFYLFKFKDEEKAERSEFDKVKASFTVKFLEFKEQEALNDWLENLRNKAKVEIKAELL